MLNKWVYIDKLKEREQKGMSEQQCYSFGCLETDWVSSTIILYNLVKQLKRNKVFSTICTIHTFEKIYTAA